MRGCSEGEIVNERNGDIYTIQRILYCHNNNILYDDALNYYIHYTHAHNFSQYKYNII